MALDTESGKTKPADELGGPLKFTSEMKRSLREFVTRAEHVDSELEALNSDKTELFEEIEEAGFDTKMVKRCIKARKKSKAEREYDQEKFDFYMSVLEEH